MEAFPAGPHDLRSAGAMPKARPPVGASDSQIGMLAGTLREPGSSCRVITIMDQRRKEFLAKIKEAEAQAAWAADATVRDSWRLIADGYRVLAQTQEPSKKSVFRF
jgi:hypothetical protein